MSTKIAKTQRSKRALAQKAPKVHENPKSLVCIKGPSSSQIVGEALKALHKFKSPRSKLLRKNNLTRPFEDASSVEFLGKVNDSSLFAYGSHSKKRPHNLVLGRLFDSQLLHMFELGIDAASWQDMETFDEARKVLVRAGGKPAVIFQGEQWDANADMVSLRNFLLDFFRGEDMEKINLAALDRVLVFSAANDKIYARHYGVQVKKSGSSAGAPRVELEEVGPRMDWTLRRFKAASDDLVRESLRQPKSLRALQSGQNLQKNMGRDALGSKTGRVHMQAQNFANLNVARLKGLQKKRKRSEDGASDAASEAGDSMADVDDNTSRASSRATSAASAASSSRGASASSVRRLMSGNSNPMDEFGGSGASVASAGSASSRRAPQQDKNLVMQRAAGFGSKPIEGGFKNVAKKKKIA